MSGSQDQDHLPGLQGRAGSDQGHGGSAQIRQVPAMLSEDAGLCGSAGSRGEAGYPHNPVETIGQDCAGDAVGGGRRAGGDRRQGNRRATRRDHASDRASYVTQVLGGWDQRNPGGSVVYPGTDCPQFNRGRRSADGDGEGQSIHRQDGNRAGPSDGGQAHRDRGAVQVGARKVHDRDGSCAVGGYLVGSQLTCARCGQPFGYVRAGGCRC